MSYRLENTAAGFGRPVIDRTQPLKFRLDGVTISGFSGDTVLSAAMAAGIAGAGRLGSADIRLGLEFAPNIRLRGETEDPGVPMALCPARDGLELMTVDGRSGGLRRLAARLTGHPPPSLGIVFGPLPIRETGAFRTVTEHQTDLVVIGGGVAGMQAALAAAEHGQRVILIEQRGRLGGDAPLFGNREGEDPVLQAVADLESALAARPEIDIRLLSRAVDAGERSVTTIRVPNTDNRLALAVERISARRIVLATGCADRLGVFPGNRLPGAVGLAEAFYLAGAYGVWPKGPTLFAGGTSALYHLALLAQDSGINILRLVDSRPAPQSRFIDFAKAMGVPQEFGSRISSATHGKNERLAVETTLAHYETKSEGRAVFAAGSIVHSDGFRPRLTLWSRLGGSLEWSETGGGPEDRLLEGHVALAGSVCGFVTTHACRQHGAQAVAALLGEPVEAVNENRIDDRFETPDAPPLRPLASSGELAFAASAAILVAMPQAAHGAGFRRNRSPGLAPDAAGTLDLETLDTLTRAGQTPPDSFVDICRERLINPRTISLHATASTPDASAPEAIPAYLTGRFGENPRLVALRSDDNRRFEPGMLVFAHSGTQPPEAAIGVVIAGKDNGGRAVLARSADAANQQVSLRDGVRAIGATVVD